MAITTTPGAAVGTAPAAGPSRRGGPGRLVGAAG
ncbi:MAG: hypothetical protein QOE27_1757, partial [Solirubrobacteraceae bacterium]|nr:hypothetical protein [Solirubrobacteraceae bacterium]